jgi:alkaline phosphatase D
MHSKMLTRREAAALLTASPYAAPYVRSIKEMPSAEWGIQTGDPTHDGAVVWSRTDRPARMLIEWSTREDMQAARSIRGQTAGPDTDYTAQTLLRGLPSGAQIYLRVRWESSASPNSLSEPVYGMVTTAPLHRRAATLLWGGDVCGQGWGIDESRGGMRIFRAMEAEHADLFVHSGDTIYADNPLTDTVRLEDGTVWRNRVTDEKSRVCQTLADFRGAQRYNRLDANLRSFSQRVPVAAQWDDHEVMNNWHPGTDLTSDERYQERDIRLLSSRARQAFQEYFPMRRSPGDPQRIFRSFRYGPQLELFLLDERSYRGPNTTNRQPVEGPDTAFLGSAQMQWIKAALRRSTARWKVIASDMPLGLVVGDTGGRFEAWANGNGPALGRELELARLLSHIRRSGIRNVVWITADVHYAAAHEYHPTRAQFTDFNPFWEFVAGPLHAGTFGPGVLDNTFGPRLDFISIPRGMRANRPPSEGLQFYGKIRAHTDDTLTVSLHNIDGRRLYSRTLSPEE